MAAESEEHVADSADVTVGHGRAGRQAQSPGKDVLGDAASTAPAPREDRLQVHGFPDGTRLDVRDLERLADRLRITPKLAWVHE